ncbi:MAG TPA: hypothetical protein G4O08_07625 [Anaerolineae bacterium]|nr:hypothetical protein [Anaerolineae bacterium]
MVRAVTPDTFSFMVLGYAVILGTMAAYTISLMLRSRRINIELRMLEDAQARERESQTR